MFILEKKQCLNENLTNLRNIDKFAKKNLNLKILVLKKITEKCFFSNFQKLKFENFTIKNLPHFLKKSFY